MGELSVVVLHCAFVGSLHFRGFLTRRREGGGRITSIFGKQFQFLLSRYLILAELIFPLCRDKRCELYWAGCWCVCVLWSYAYLMSRSPPSADLNWGFMLVARQHLNWVHLIRYMPASQGDSKHGLAAGALAPFLAPSCPFCACASSMWHPAQLPGLLEERLALLSCVWAGLCPKLLTESWGCSGAGLGLWRGWFRWAMLEAAECQGRRSVLDVLTELCQSRQWPAGLQQQCLAARWVWCTYLCVGSGYTLTSSERGAGRVLSISIPLFWGPVDLWWAS